MVIGPGLAYIILGPRARIVALLDFVFSSGSVWCNLFFALSSRLCLLERIMLDFVRRAVTSLFRRRAPIMTCCVLLLWVSVSVWLSSAILFMGTRGPGAALASGVTWALWLVVNSTRVLGGPCTGW